MGSSEPGEVSQLGGAAVRLPQLRRPWAHLSRTPRGQSLMDAREVLNISIEDFAARMDESPADIRDYEAGVYMTRQRTSSTLVPSGAAKTVKKETPG